MREELLAYLWKTQYFSRKSLQTTDGDDLVVVKPGQENSNAGPDFSNAHIQLNKTLWVGNVELHVRASDWFNHRHEEDTNYDNVIQHAVWENDLPVFDVSQQPMPTLCLSEYVPNSILKKYERWITQDKKWISCADKIHTVSEFLQTQFWERLYVERLMEKTALFQHWLSLTKNNWEAVFFVALAEGFGLKQNGLAFANMALATPWKAVLNSASNAEELEALFFGQSNLLQKPVDHAYFKHQQKTYLYLQYKYQLRPIPESPKFFRLRPANFPTIRLSQLAWLTSKQPRLLSHVQAAKSLDALYALLQAKTTSFWESHYQFHTPAKQQQRKLTKSFIQLLLLNTVFPFLFHYYKYTGDGRVDQILDWVRQLPPEKNNYSLKFKELGCTIEDALESQACIQLKTNYCNQRRCLSCTFGHKLLNL